MFWYVLSVHDYLRRDSCLFMIIWEEILWIILLSFEDIVLKSNQYNMHKKEERHTKEYEKM